MLKKILGLVVLLGLTACGSNPQSYITSKKSPIINVESSVSDFVKIDAKVNALTLSNQTEQLLGLAYTLIWYDGKGVSQTLSIDDKTPWYSLCLDAKQTYTTELNKPTPESENYRLYLKAARCLKTF